jgi:hypothetical protein
MLPLFCLFPPETSDAMVVVEVGAVEVRLSWAKTDFGCRVTLAARERRPRDGPYFTGGKVIGSGAWEAGQGRLYLAMISFVAASQCSLPNAL